MKDFAHISASSVDHALSVLRDHGQVAMQPARPLRMNCYKVDLNKILIRRALQAITP